MQASIVHNATDPKSASPAAITPELGFADVDDAPALAGEPLARLTAPALFGGLAAVILPFLGLIAAGILFWDTRFSWLNLGMLLGGYLLTALGIIRGYHFRVVAARL